MRRTLIGAAGAVAGAALVLAGNVATRTGAIIAGPRPAVARAPVRPGRGQFLPATQAPGAPAPGLPSGSKTVTGPAVDTPFGPVQVKVSISGGRITDVQAVQTPSEHMRSVEINQYATPILHQEVLAAQSANVDLVSGATYTSEAYAQSLQAAIDQAAK